MLKNDLREDGAARGENATRVWNETASGSSYDERHSPQVLINRVGSKVHCADDLYDSAASTEASYELENAAVQNNQSSNKELELPSIRSSGLTKVNSEVGTPRRIQKETLPSNFPVFYASEQGPWSAMICYEACVRLCLHSRATDSVSEASYFLNDDCVLLRNAFGLQNLFLRSEEEQLGNRPSTLVTETTIAPKCKRSVGKIKLQVGKIKIGLDSNPGCQISSLKHHHEIVSQQISELSVTLSSGWKAVKRVHVPPRVVVHGSLSRKSRAYMRSCAKYLKQISKALQQEFVETHSTRQRSLNAVPEKYSCSLRLKSSAEEDHVITQPESGETFVFLPDSICDDLIIDVRDSSGHFCGRVIAQLAAIADEPNERLKWWTVYHEPEHERIGRIQIHINYSSSLTEKTKCGLVAEAPAYDLVLEVAMKAMKFQRRNLLIEGPWRWMLTQFANYYGISDAYTKLRYLSYVMDVASPTKDCLDLIYDFLSPILTERSRKELLSHQEKRLLGEIDDNVRKILASTFENYKSLDESCCAGINDVFEPPTRTPAPALTPAIKLYVLLSDMLAPEAQLRLCRYFQSASKKRSQRYLSETKDVLHNRLEGAQATSCQKMKSLILSLRKEISTDISINNSNVIPRYIDLPKLSAAIYSADLIKRLREYLTACPPPSPSPPVVDLVITTADFEADLLRWNIMPINDDFNVLELFNPYITTWIEEKKNSLHEFCKSETGKAYSEIQGMTSPFVDKMYELLNVTLDEFDVIVRRWPYYAVCLEKVVARSEKAMIEALEKKYSERLSSLNDSKISALKFVHRLTKKGTSNIYFVPEELGVLLNSLNAALDDLRPSIETRFKEWNSYLSVEGNREVLGKRLNEVTVRLRSKFRSHMEAVVEKLAENMRIHSHMKMKNIIHDIKGTTEESDVRNRMQSLKELLDRTIDHLHDVLSPDVFVLTCRELWDRMGQEVLYLLENRKDNRVTWHKGLSIAVSVLDEIFMTQMRSYLGDSLKEEDFEAPGSMMELQSMLCGERNGFYY